MKQARQVCPGFLEVTTARGGVGTENLVDDATRSQARSDAPVIVVVAGCGRNSDLLDARLFMGETSVSLHEICRHVGRSIR